MASQGRCALKRTHAIFLVKTRCFSFRIQRRLVSTAAEKVRSFLPALASASQRKQERANLELGIQKQFAESYRESFIPVTRRTLLRYVLENESLLSEEDRVNFDRFVSALDTVIANSYRNQSLELRALFDPINPDKETLASKSINRKDRLDSEFWLLQKMAAIMRKANFHELPTSLVKKLLTTKDSKEGVQVTVNPDAYGVLKFWVLGKEEISPTYSLLDRLRNFIPSHLSSPSPTAPVTYFKRVVVACRLHRDDKLTLKVFKEIPVKSLEQLLPEGRVSASHLHKSLSGGAAAVASLAVFSGMVSKLAGLAYMPSWTLGLCAASGAFWFGVATTHQRKRVGYLSALNQTLYYKTVATNRGLLALVVERAQDESFKETLLTYAFLLRSSPSYDTDPEELLDNIMLENQVEQWIAERTGAKVAFDCRESLSLLESCGLLSRSEGALSVPSVESAVRLLPNASGPSAAAVMDESDVLEGYEKSVLDESEVEYKRKEKRNKKTGWL